MARIKLTHLIFLCLTLLLLNSCKRDKPIDGTGEVFSHPLFQLLTPAYTGVTFGNYVVDTGTYNFFNMNYIYNGGGVAIGDINNDGLQDIFLTSNEFKSRLYLNLGDFKFKDITEEAGIDTRGGWTTGAQMADINGDGLTDIYVCRGGIKPADNTQNLCFINLGGNHFKEMATELGINDRGLTTTATFFDYDNDGDLDLYTLNYPVFTSDPNNFYFYHSTAADSTVSDKLFENVDGHFVNVTTKANLPIEKASGLGLVVADINQDGYQDIYVGNDWVPNDYLYINQGNKTFKDECASMFSKNTYFTMGCDIADVNNDALPDVFTTDMAPSSHYRRKVLINQAPIDYYFLEAKYQDVLQYSRNTLQINTGAGKFEERGEMAGISRTDWSWSALWSDFDNDGWKDLFVGKGNKRNVGDMDYERLMFDAGDKPHFRMNKDSLIAKMSYYVQANHAFRNNQGQNFSDVIHPWGLDQMVNTQGVAYADLNNDGKVDLILNNVDTVAFIYRNTGGGEANHYLSVAVKGTPKNSTGLGTKCWLYTSNGVQYDEITNARGFQSNSEPRMHFGLGSLSKADSLVMVYPGGKYEVIVDPKVDTMLTVNAANGEGQYSYPPIGSGNQLLSDKTNLIRPLYVHTESDFNDFKRDKLIPRMFSKEGPALAIGDINGDGRDDFFVGGAAGKPGKVYLQLPDAGFREMENPALNADAAGEDVAAYIADFNGDGKNDLYVVRGSNEFDPGSQEYSDALFLNRNGLEKCADCLPAITGSKSCIAVYDYDGDGDKDVFIGGRTLPRSYGKIPDSYLLRNDNGHFTDVTEEVAPGLRKVGMVTQAAWLDIDGDKKNELLVIGDWISPTVYKSIGGKLKDITAQTGLSDFTGWWSAITIGDFDNDGDMDFACGNWGLNSIWKATSKEPLCLLVNDFDGNGSIDPVLCFYMEGKMGTFGSRDYLFSAMTKFFKKYHTYESFATTSIEDLFTRQAYDSADKLYATELRSAVFINNGKGHFNMQPLPVECQAAPVNSIAYDDFDGDGIKDLLVAGNTNENFYDEGSIDALKGVLLKGDGKGTFKPVAYRQSGIYLDKFVRNMALISSVSSKYLLCANNSDTLKLYQLTSK